MNKVVTYTFSILDSVDIFLLFQLGFLIAKQ